MNKYLKLENLSAYQMSSDLSDYVWEIVSRWDWFSKQTIGSQFVRSVDSIAANIAEGFGRYHKKDKMKFYYNARSSAMESIHWNDKANKRKLLSEQEDNYIKEKMFQMPKEINYLIKYTKEKLTI